MMDAGESDEQLRAQSQLMPEAEVILEIISGVFNSILIAATALFGNKKVFNYSHNNVEKRFSFIPHCKCNCFFENCQNQNL